MDFFPEGLASYYHQNVFHRKNEENYSYRKNFDLKKRLCSFLAQISSKEATDFARKGPNPAEKRGPGVDFKNVHAWTSPKVDICETNFRSPCTWTLLTSTRGHCQGPRADHAQSRLMVCAWTSRENTKISNKKKNKIKLGTFPLCTCMNFLIDGNCFILLLHFAKDMSGFEPGTPAWKSSVLPTTQRRKHEIRSP